MSADLDRTGARSFGVAGVLAAGAAMLLLASCEEKEAATAPAARPAAVVAVVEVKPQNLPVVSELPGRVAPAVMAEVKPRVSGLVLKRVFEQGATVKAGDLLYVIDPKPFEAKVQSAKAMLDSASAARTLAQQKADRQVQLRERNVASVADSDAAVAELARATADVSRAEADLLSANLELQYTELRAPISGRIGRALVTEGELVGSNSNAMATIHQLDPIYADFTQPADTLVILKNAVQGGMLQADEKGDAVLKLVSEQGRGHPQDGKLLFSEASVNSQTGQLILRAEFPNPDGDLLPGMYVRTRIAQGTLKDALAVPEQAVQRNTAGVAQVYVVKSDDTVEVRDARLGWVVDGRWVIIDGLSAGDRVVVEGFQKIAPGAKVKAEPWVPKPSASLSATRD